MLYRLVRPVKRPGSSRHQFVKRIPADLKGRLAGMKLDVPLGTETATVKIGEATETIRFSLRASEPSEVRSRQAAAAAFFEGIFRSLRESRPVELTHRQAVALSGEIYRGWSADLESGRQITLEHDGERWVRATATLPELEAGYAAAFRQVEGWIGSEVDLEPSLGAIVDARLRARGIMSVTQESREMLLAEFAKALRQGLDVGRRKAGGDYSPDPNSERFPEWQAPTQQAPSGTSLKGLVDSWWKEAEPAGLSLSTFESYRKAINALADLLDHDDAAAVRPDDILRFKDHLLGGGTGKPVSAKTVKDSYLSGLKSVFGWAVNNRKIAVNPAAGITLKLGKKKRVRESWFKPEEIKAILSASASLQRGRKEPPARHALKRWVPWLCAYTGARVGEIVQLRKHDVRKEGGHWVITITPEAGRVKNKEAREFRCIPIWSNSASRIS